MVRKFKKGFGILEVLISSVIIMIILGALVFIGRSAMANSEYIQERAQAIYLAQEGLELVRQIRDTNWIDGTNTAWDSMKCNSTITGFEANPIAAGNNYELAYISSIKRYCLNTPSELSEIDIAQGSAISAVKYKRKIILERGDNLLPENPLDQSTKVYSNINAMKVTAEVTWLFNGAEKNITVSEMLTNWRPNF